MSTTAVNTTRFDVPVPAGVVPRAITGVLTMPEVVNNGVVTFRVNGRIARTVPSTLYAKVRIPVTAADVIADGTIGLTMASQGPAIDNVCRPAAGEASLRKIALTYRGQEQRADEPGQLLPAVQQPHRRADRGRRGRRPARGRHRGGRGAQQPLPGGHRDRAGRARGRPDRGRGHRSASWCSRPDVPAR